MQYFPLASDPVHSGGWGTYPSGHFAPEPHHPLPNATPSASGPEPRVLGRKSSSSLHPATASGAHGATSSGSHLASTSSAKASVPSASPPPSPKVKKRRRTPSGTSPAPIASSTASSATSNGPLSGSSVTPSYSSPSSPQTPHSNLQNYDEAQGAYVYDSAYVSAGSSPHTSYTNSPHSLSYFGQQPLTGDWDENYSGHGSSLHVPGGMGQPPMSHRLSPTHTSYSHMPYPPPSGTVTGRAFGNYGFVGANVHPDSVRGSVSPIHRRDNPLQMSAPATLPSAAGGRPSGASSLPTNLPSAYHYQYGSGSVSGGLHPHAEINDESINANHYEFDAHSASGINAGASFQNQSSIHHPAFPGASNNYGNSSFSGQTIPGSSLLDHSAHQDAPIIDMNAYLDNSSGSHMHGGVAMDPFSSGGFNSSSQSPMMAMELDSPVYPPRRHVASPGSPNPLAPGGMGSKSPSLSRRSGSQPLIGTLGSSSPAILARGVGVTPNNTIPSYVAPPGSAGGFPKSQNAFSGAPMALPRQTFMRGHASKAPVRTSSNNIAAPAFNPATGMDAEVSEVMHVLDAFVTIFEPRAPINLELNWTGAESKPYWVALLSSGAGNYENGGQANSGDEISLIFSEISSKLLKRGNISTMPLDFEDSHAYAVKLFLRWFEQCVVLLAGCSALGWTSREMVLAKHAENFVQFYANCERFDLNSPDISEKECARLVDTLTLHAAYHRDRAYLQGAVRSLGLAYNVISSFPTKISLEVADRLYVWTLFIVTAPNERAYWFQTLTQAGFQVQGQTPMAMMVTQQSTLFSHFAAGPRPDADLLNRLWPQIDEFEQLVLTCEKTHRSRAFRYLRLAAASLLRAEIYSRWQNFNEAQTWTRHLQEIAALSPGLKTSLLTTVKSIGEQAMPDGEMRGISCSHTVCALLDAVNPGGNAVAYSLSPQTLSNSSSHHTSPPPAINSMDTSSSSIAPSHASTSATASPATLSASSSMAISSTPTGSKVSTPVSAPTISSPGASNMSIASGSVASPSN